MTANSRVFDAPPPAATEVPAYRVEEYNGPPIEKVICKFDEKQRIIQKETVLLEGGYMVRFPKGHSNYYPDLQSLEAAGLGEVVPVIRMGANSEAEIGKDIPEKTTRRVIVKAE